jgi:6-hydroxynicotinate 3-monooxygenase
MNTESKPLIVIVGAGPAGLAAALAGIRSGLSVTVLERFPQVKPAGNILNLWPPPQKVLDLIGVDIHDLGAPNQSEFRRADGRVRAKVRLPQDVMDAFGGGFIGLLRPGLYHRMLGALPEGVVRYEHVVTGFTDTPEGVLVHLESRPDLEAAVLVGCDGINSIVRRQLWGDSPIRHQKLHLVAGYMFCDAPEPVAIIAHNRRTQGSYSAIVHEGRSGYEWWVLEAFDPNGAPPVDLRAHALELSKGFVGPLRSLIERTPEEDVFRWEIRDRKPIKQWAKGRVTLAGDAAHPTSPYAAYGAGMSIEDGYFLMAELEQINLEDPVATNSALQAYEERRKKHTATISQIAWMNGMLFHRAPKWLAPLRDLFFDHTPFLQKMIGESTPTQILSQLAEIDAVEQNRATSRSATQSAA